MTLENLRSIMYRKIIVLHGHPRDTDPIEPTVIDMIEQTLWYPVHGTLSSVEQMVFEAVSTTVHSDK